MDEDDRYAAVDRAAEANALHRPVVIEDGVVSRPAGAHTATVHGYLRHLRAQGLECVPEPLGVVDGTESLRFIDGADGGEGWWHQHTDQGLASAARLLRRIHDAGAGWVPPDDAVWGATPVAGDEVVPCHGAGIEPQATWVADGAEERDLEEIAWIEAYREVLAP